MKSDEVSPSGSADATSAISRYGTEAEPGPRHEPLVWVFAAAAIGVIFDRYGSPAITFSTGRGSDGSVVLATCWLASVSCLAAWFISWRANREIEPACLLLLCVAFVAAAWHHVNWYDFGQQEISRFAGFAPGPACVEVIARETPERVVAPRSTPLRAIPGTERSRLMVDVQAIRDGRNWLPASGTCQLATEGHLLGVHPGDRLRVYGQLARTAPPLNPGEFDFAAHARADGHLARFRSSTPECVVRLASGSRLAPEYLLDRVRTGAQQLVRTLIGPQKAGLAAAILLGAREGLPLQETEPYLETGTIHVLVVSGMNVAILAFGMFALMQIGWLPRRVALGVIMAIVVAYALLAEAQPPVVRSAVVGVLFCTAAWMGRRGSAFNSLFAAACVVLVLNPSDFFRAGPQLSFLAVAALIWVGSWSIWPRTRSDDPLDELIDRKRKWHERAGRWMARFSYKALLLSLLVWLVTLPLVLSAFHIASPVAVLVSPVVSIIVFFTMWSGFLMLVVGMAFPAIGAVFGQLCSLTLSLLEGIVNWADQVPGGHFWVPGPAWWWVAVFYVALMLVMVRGDLIKSRRWQTAALAIWILIGLLPPTARYWTRSELACSFVSVGHGACVLVETPDGRTFMYDAGAIGSPEYATQTIASYLWHRGIMRIDGLVISHADIDHYNAVPGLIERFRIGTVYVSPVMFTGFGDDGTITGAKVLLDAIQHAGIPIREIWSGDRLTLGSGVAARVFHPPERGIIGNDNANSLTLGIEYAGRRLLLPGDLESPGIEDVMAEEPYDCDILLAPHHGSRRSDPPGFAAWSRPEWVVVSGGGGDDIGSVRRAYEQTGSSVLATIDTGTVRFDINSELLKVTSWHSTK